MDVAVVYESLYGSTRQVAEAIADGVKQADPDAHVAVIPVAKAVPGKAGQADLLIVGGPTHIMRMSSQRTRRQGMQAAEKAEADEHEEHHLEQDAAGPGVREWLAALPETLPGHRAAAFDTRLRYPMAGGAAKPIARQLRHHGYQLAAGPEGFTLDGAEGPLREGERDRAKAWGATLAGQVVTRSGH